MEVCLLAPCPWLGWSIGSLGPYWEGMAHKHFSPSFGPHSHLCKWSLSWNDLSCPLTELPTMERLILTSHFIDLYNVCGTGQWQSQKYMPAAFFHSRDSNRKISLPIACTKISFWFIYILKIRKEPGWNFPSGGRSLHFSVTSSS